MPDDSIIWGLDLNELITLGISSFALIVSFWDRYVNFKSNREADKKIKQSNNKAEEAIKLSQGAIELEVRNSMSDARKRVDDFGLEFQKFKLDYPEANFKAHQKNFKSVLENYYNVYDNTCSLYLDNKIDRNRFKKDYKKEICNLFEKGKVVISIISFYPLLMLTVTLMEK